MHPGFVPCVRKLSGNLIIGIEIQHCLHAVQEYDIVGDHRNAPS